MEKNDLYETHKSEENIPQCEISKKNVDSSYEKRLKIFLEVSLEDWTDWKWQQRNTLRPQNIEKFFPNLPSNIKKQAEAWVKRGMRFQLTPYLLSLVQMDNLGNPLQNDPIWLQFFPDFEEIIDSDLVQIRKKHPDEYSPNEENWEQDDEMLTPICHHKYEDRVILYTTDNCLSYCNYCLRSLASTADEEKHGGAQRYWQETMEKIKANPAIEEVILSGGDPLILENSKLQYMLEDIRKIPTVRAIRIHTRAWTHNPFRINDNFCRLLKEYDVTEMAVHMAHPREITTEFKEAVDRVRKSGARTMLLAQIPLIKKVNDDPTILRNFFMDLYTASVKPYYFLHNMPNIPAAASQRTTVKKGVQLLQQIGRKLAHPAMPEYIIVHRTGKRTVPLQAEGTLDFQYEKTQDGHPMIRFIDWKGNEEIYPDGTEEDK